MDKPVELHELTHLKEVHYIIRVVPVASGLIPPIIETIYKTVVCYDNDKVKRVNLFTRSPADVVYEVLIKRGERVVKDVAYILYETVRIRHFV